MAGLLETYMQEIRVKYPTMFDKLEWRFTKNGILLVAKEITDSANSIVTADLREKALRSEGRDLKIPVMKQGALTVKNQRSCTIGDYENESAMVEVNWTTLVVDFSMVKAQYAKNEISYNEDLAKKLQLVRDAFAKAMEQALYARLELDKSEFYNSTLVGTGNRYPLVGDAMQVAKAQQDLFFNDVEVIMEGDDFDAEMVYILGSTALQSSVRHWANQGKTNDENLEYQFTGKKFRFSNRVPPGTGNFASGFILIDGSIGLITRVNIDAEMGNVAGDGTRWEKATIPGFPYEVGVMYKSKCADKSTLNGTGLEHLTATHVEQWQFSIDFGIVTPYQSDPNRPQPIKKFEFKNV